MRQVRIGDITIDAVIEREGPWRRPQDFFPAYDEAIFKRHLPTMEPEVFDQALGMMVITYQTFVVRTPHYTILVDTCTGEDKGYPAPMDFPKQPWLDGFAAAGNEAWQAPGHWRNIDGEWQIMTLGGLQPIDPAAPVCHVSYYEADAFARWSAP